MDLTKEDFRQLIREEVRPLERKMDENYQSLSKELNSSRVEMYKREFEMMRVADFGGSPFRMEASPLCLGNSATNPDYDVFLDEDYGI